VLIPAAKGEAYDGIANFFRIETGDGCYQSDTRRIRVLTDADVTNENARRILGADDYRVLTGALDLKQGLSTEDAKLRQQGFQKIEPSPLPGSLAEFFAQNPRWAQLRFPVIVTDQLEDVRLVMWFAPKRQQFTPALFCPNLRVGVFLKSLMDVRSCPHCGDLFLPRKTNVLYHSVTCREAYRTGRSRWRKKQKQLKATLKSRPKAKTSRRKATR
jgi:hypothetical protein